jgi:malonate transporter
MSDFLTVLPFAFSVTGPIFLILMLGIWLARIGLITDAFIDAGSKLVFNVTLPSLLFVSISTTSIEHAANFVLIGFALVGTFVAWLLLEWLSGFLVQPPEERGVVVQGAFRSNMGIIGLAYCANAYGDHGIAAASIYLGLVTILLNVLSVITLSRSLHRNRSASGIAAAIARNPLILGILLALPVAWARIQLPSVLLTTAEYLAQTTLPLALLCTGASLNLKTLLHESRNAVLSGAGKLVLVPVLLTTGGWLIGFRGMDLGILFLMSSSPTAAASYVMARAMGGNAGLAANIIVLTTMGSLFVTSFGIVLLRSHGLI